MLILTGCALLPACASTPPSGSGSPRASATALAPAATSFGGGGPTLDARQPGVPPSTPLPFPSSPPLPTAATANQVARTVPRCHTWQLQLVLNHAVGGTGSIVETFEVRNRSALRCGLTGYFGASTIDANGVAYAVADRSTVSHFGPFPAPAEVILPAGSAPLTPMHAAGPPYFAVPGHAYFALQYSGPCNEGRMTEANRWRLFPPDETVPLVVRDDGLGRANCPTVMPVSAGLGLSTP